MLPLWDYARAVYKEPEVQDALLTLQDRFRLDVNVVLWALWCGRYGLTLEKEDAVAVVTSIRAMAEHVTRPLRGARRFLRTSRPGFPPEAQQDLRRRVLEVELASEELVLRRLDAATLERTSANPELHDMGARAEALFIIARNSMDMPTVIADERGHFSPLALFREVLKLAEDHGP